MNEITIHEASIILGLPEFLIRDFSSYEFNEKKLLNASTESSSFVFHINAIQEFQKHIEAPWPGEGRIEPPNFVKRYLKYEAQATCALCHNAKPNYDYAHIKAWSKSRNNSPHNLLYLCIDCHRSHGNDEKLLRGVKEELLKRIQLLDLSLLYECSEDITQGEAVYVLNGNVYRAIAQNNSGELATGFVKTKIGPDRCTIQRTGVVLSIGNLETGKEYFLSSSEQGKIVTRETFNEARDLSKEVIVQPVGKAESNTHLAINLGVYITIKAGCKA